ncbi:MAG: tetratricopeptide repeat protein, partial [Deltaproteobacteria bacterium]|nr:tetratricopeptide repeat protein [Deltaproteobacteria bacterium]
ALNVTPDWTGLHVNLGQLFSALGRHRLAQKELLLAVAGDPHDSIAAFNLARLHRRQGETEQAIAWFEKTLSLDDDYADARPELASMLYEQGSYQRSATLLEEELQRDGACPVCHHNLGLALLQLGRPDEALTHLMRALDLDPRYFRAHYNLAALSAAQGWEQQALEHLERAFELDPDTTRAWLDLDRADFVQLASHPRLLQLLGARVALEQLGEHRIDG